MSAGTGKLGSVVWLGKATIGMFVFSEVLKNAIYIPPITSSRNPMATGIQSFDALAAGIAFGALGIGAGLGSLTGPGMGLVWTLAAGGGGAGI